MSLPPRVYPLGVPCPKCGAPAGARCIALERNPWGERRRTWSTHKYHKPRITAAARFPQPQL